MAKGIPNMWVIKKLCVTFSQYFWWSKMIIGTIEGFEWENDKTWSVSSLAILKNGDKKEETFLGITWRAPLVCRIQCIPRATLLLKNFQQNRRTWTLRCRRSLGGAFRSSMEFARMSSFLKKAGMMLDCFAAQILQYPFFFFYLSLNWNTHNER